MRLDDPLEKWLFLRTYRSADELAERQQRELIFAGSQLLPALDAPSPPDDGRAVVERLQDAFRQVYALGGPGSTRLQEELLDAIAFAADPVSIPFWIETLSLHRPRDTFEARRRRFALAALTFMAIHRELPAAYSALHAAMRHELPDVRASAVQYLGRAYLQAKQSLPPEVMAALSDIAVRYSAFGPRYQARALLRDAGQPVPLDNPGGGYIFKVKFMWAKRIFRSITVRSEQTLDDLHGAIQRAIDWDADHLYSFFMNGNRYDDSYRVRCTYEADEENTFVTSEAVIGELGLVAKHKFLYYFDYGDGNQFEVETIDIRPQAEPGAYPRVVASKGEAPSQYGADIEGEGW